MTRDKRNRWGGLAGSIPRDGGNGLVSSDSWSRLISQSRGRENHPRREAEGKIPMQAKDIVRRVRLVTGLTLFAYLLTHYLNHSAGLISLDAMEEGRSLFLLLWRNWPMTLLLYGAIFIHQGLAYWSIYQRRSLRMA